MCLGSVKVGYRYGFSKSPKPRWSRATTVNRYVNRCAKDFMHDAVLNIHAARVCPGKITDQGTSRSDDVVKKGTTIVFVSPKA